MILEVKGFETEQNRQKETAARHWVRAVNYHGELGCWVFCLCKEPRSFAKAIRQAVAIL
ncbi:hypothetical protein HRbin36_02029 [bacterium HR36]|nr:hypothetical protein HRbin36_02029 [bacterium HR36]